MAIFFPDAVKGGLCGLHSLLMGGEAVDIINVCVCKTADVPVYELLSVLSGFLVEC
jgi:hypothetical protein